MAYFKFDKKKIYFQEIGSGEPILLLPGNSASSMMFQSISGMYTQDFKIILIDFPGHGKSERVEKFEPDFWLYNASVCNALLEELDRDKVSLIGTSGGALVGINFAMEYPEKVKYLIADSFMGEYPLPAFFDKIGDEREAGKKNPSARAFWAANHGSDWENVVDLDTEMLINFSRSGESFFHKSISELSVPALLTGSKEDEHFNSLGEIYAELKKKNERLDFHMFEAGSHPAMLSNRDRFYDLVKEKLRAPKHKI